MACNPFTKSAQSSGPENVDPERPRSGLPAAGPVLSSSRITLENNGKIWPQPDRENAFARASGGEGVRHNHPLTCCFCAIVENRTPLFTPQQIAATPGIVTIGKPLDRLAMP